MITFLNLKNNLKGGGLSAFCLVGNDRWLKRKSLATVREFFGIEDDGFGVDRLDSPTYKQVEAACCTPSMFAAQKLVVVEDFQIPVGKQQIETAQKLEKLISECDGSFCLVFFADQSDFYSKINGLTLVNCDKLDSSSVIKWIVAYCKKQGVEVPAQCAAMIAEYCLFDMSRISTETQKLLDYGEVSLRSVELLVHKDTEFVVFNLSKTICAKNAQAALELYNGLIASGEEARGLFGLLYNTFRRAYYVKTTEQTENLAELLGVKPYAVQRTKEIAANYKPMQLKRILNCFEDADCKLKAFVDETEVMTTLILQLVSA